MVVRGQSIVQDVPNFAACVCFGFLEMKTISRPHKV